MSIFYFISLELKAVSIELYRIYSIYRIVAFNPLAIVIEQSTLFILFHLDMEISIYVLWRGSF